MKTSTLEELTVCDPATRSVFPFQGDILPVIQEGISGFDLCDAVPEPVAEHYERSRKLFVRGYFDYEIFTVAGEYAVISVEMALRERLTMILPGETEWLYEKASLHNLVDKAAKVGLIDNPDRCRDFEALKKFRNHVLHGKETMLVAPGAARQAIQLVSQLIDYIWRS